MRILLSIIFLIFSACSGGSSGGSSAGGGVVGGEGGGSAPGSDSAGFTSGPVDIPITISKTIKPVDATQFQFIPNEDIPDDPADTDTAGSLLGRAQETDRSIGVVFE